MISLSGVSKNFGDFTAVDGVSLEITSGEAFGIVGPNGAGKSTIVKMLCTILEPSSGRISVNGLDACKDAQKVRSLIGYLPEEPRTYDYMSGKEYLEFFCGIYKVDKKKSQELLDFVGISEHAHRKVGEYSKGMKQRLSIARALVHDPPIIVFDEPTMGLDPASARELREKIRQMKNDGKTAIICTHYMDEADFLCDRIAIISKGKVAAVGKPEELKRKTSPRARIKVVFDKYSKDLEEFWVAEKSGRGLIVEEENLKSTIAKVSKGLEKYSEAKPLTIHSIEPSLDDVFIKVTKQEAKDQTNENQGK